MSLTYRLLTFARGLPVLRGLLGRRLFLRPQRGKLQRRKHCDTVVVMLIRGSAFVLYATRRDDGVAYTAIRRYTLNAHRIAGDSFG